MAAVSPHAVLMIGVTGGEIKQVAEWVNEFMNRATIDWGNNAGGARQEGVSNGEVARVEPAVATIFWQVVSMEQGETDAI